MKNKANWTLLVYMGGDNNLESFGFKDLYEMKSVGSTDAINIIAQFDKMSDNVTRRYRLQEGTTLNDDLLEELPETNTGDPQVLIDFSTWGIDHFPAEKYGLILWNHGSGWKDDDIYQLLKKTNKKQRIPRGQERVLLSGKSSRSLFRTTIESFVEHAGERAILFDDSSKDFLDNLELKNVLHQIVSKIGRPIDILGFDACLMNMIEVIYQVREYCSVVVGSQETEPGDGWPYNEIIRRLNIQPQINPQKFGKLIVDQYVEYYKKYYPNLPVTQSAIDTCKATELSKVFFDFSLCIEEKIQNRGNLPIIYDVLRKVQCFTDRDYVDLRHFFDLVIRLFPDKSINDFARNIEEIFQNKKTSPIISSEFSGNALKNACGLSLYFPIRIYSSIYDTLDFALDGHWSSFLRSMFT